MYHKHNYCQAATVNRLISDQNNELFNLFFFFFIIMYIYINFKTKPSVTTIIADSMFRTRLVKIKTKLNNV